MHFVRPLICFCVLLSTTFAQTVRWENAGTGDPADLQLIYEDCKPDGDPQIPSIPGARLGFRGKSEQTSIINFSVTRTVVFSYRLQISKAAAVQIPSFKVRTNEGELTVPAYSTDTVKPGPEADIKAMLRPGKDSVWAGEVFPLTYMFDVSRRSFNNFAGGIDWDSNPLIVEDWSKAEGTEITRSGEKRLIVSTQTRGYATSPGNYQLKPIAQLINLAIGTSGFRLFQQQRIEQVAIRTDQPELQVRALPMPQPSNFDGAVGQFQLTSKIVPENAAVGEPITWTLELSGTGNWPDIAGLPARSVSKEFQVIQPEAKQTPAEGKLFDATLVEDVVLVPISPGTYTLGSVEFTFFDPETGSYQTARTPGKTITVNPAPAPTIAGTPSLQTPAADTTTPPAPITAPEATVDPKGIPRDPILGSDQARTPFTTRSSLLTAALVPFAGVLLVWLILAARSAHQTDPRKPQRLAKKRLAATLAQLSQATESAQADLLIAWQHDTATLWSLDHAAPAADDFKNKEWSTLWTEAEQVLYSSQCELSSDWSARATAALAAHKVPGTAWLHAFLPRNLFPFFAVVLCLSLLPSLNAKEADQAYRSGDFSAAEKTWAEAVEETPTDWIARHNLSLALAQQERWGEAAAQATAAFVQHPQSDANRWNLALAYQKAGYTPTAIAPLLGPRPLNNFAKLASPATWEWFIVTSAIGIALALIAVLLVAYRIAPRWIKWIAVVVILIDTALIAVSFAGRSAYGIAADPQVALVWRTGTLYSIPTEADTTQQTTTLSAGAMGTMSDQDFLGWTQLTFPNGQTGWVRKSELIAIWK